LLGRAADLAAVRPWCCFDAGGKRSKNRIEATYDVGIPADHQTVALLDSPHPAARSDVDVVDVLGLQFLGATNVAVLVRVAAVNDRVARIQQSDERRNFVIHNSRRQHHPDGARRR
jgi:hypothetical protein